MKRENHLLLSHGGVHPILASILCKYIDGFWGQSGAIITTAPAAGTTS
jgi:hypothetical protein